MDPKTPQTPGTPAPEPGSPRHRKIVLTVAALGVVSVIGGMATWSAFVGTTGNPDNTFDAVDVELTDSDGGGVGSQMFAVTNMQPGDSVERCIEVSYTGTTTSEVRLYASSKGSGTLNDDLDVVVKRGTAAATTGGVCDTFVEDGSPMANPANLTIASFPTTFGTGLDGTTWMSPESHVYQFTVTLNALVDPAEAGASGGPVVFTWEAQPTP